MNLFNTKSLKIMDLNFKLVQSLSKGFDTFQMAYFGNGEYKAVALMIERKLNIAEDWFKVEEFFHLIRISW